MQHAEGEQTSPWIQPALESREAGILLSDHPWKAVEEPAIPSPFNSAYVAPSELPNYNITTFSHNWLSPGDHIGIEWADEASLFGSNGGDCEPPTAPFIDRSREEEERWAWPASLPGFSPTVGVISPIPNPFTTLQQCSSSVISTDSRSEVGNAASTASTSSTATLYVEGDAGRAPFRARAIRRHSDKTKSGAKVARSGAFRARATETQPEAQIPAENSLPSHVVENLIKQVKEGIALAEDSSLNSHLLPSQAQIQNFFCLFFRCFHPAFPFLYPGAQFYVPPQRWVILLALCAVGSRYAEDSADARVGLTLFKLLDRTLASLFTQTSFSSLSPPWANRAPRLAGEEEPLLLLQAVTLHLVWKTHSGDQQAIHDSLTDRYRLVEACRALRLLSANMPDLKLIRDSPNSSPPARLRPFHDELRIRTGLMIWVSKFYNGRKFDTFIR